MDGCPGDTVKKLKHKRKHGQRVGEKDRDRDKRRQKQIETTHTHFEEIQKKRINVHKKALSQKRKEGQKIKKKYESI